MRKLIFIRHGETDMAGTFCGHTDPCLNDAGRAQVAGLVQGLDAESFDTVFSSDLKRARETAETIAANNDAPLTMLPELREIGFGAWEGLRWAEIETADDAYATRWIAEFPGLPAPGGERFADFRTRVLECVRIIVAEGVASAAVVTHAGVMRVVLEELCGKSATEAAEMTRSYCAHFIYTHAEVGA